MADRVNAPRKWVLECPIDTSAELLAEVNKAFAEFLDDPDKNICVFAGVVVKEVSK